MFRLRARAQKKTGEYVQVTLMFGNHYDLMDLLADEIAERFWIDGVWIETSCIDHGWMTPWSTGECAFCADERATKELAAMWEEWENEPDDEFSEEEAEFMARVQAEEEAAWSLQTPEEVEQIHADYGRYL